MSSTMNAINLIFTLLLILQSNCIIHAFSPSTPIRTSTSTSTTTSRSNTILLNLSYSPLTTTDSDTYTLTDSNNNEFKIGSIVQLTQPIQAYHVPAKAFGSFDDQHPLSPTTQTFLPLTNVDNVERKEKCLKLPIGFKGIVTRVYNIHDLDASLPIVVKFVQEGVDVGGGVNECQVPATFTMHFETYELLVVMG